MRDTFMQLATRVTAAAGSPFALLLAVAVIGAWLVSGPVFGFSDTWQLVINTATTIITFLMVFVIQATTNREMKATQIKLDELIRAVKGARNALIATDLIPEDEVDELHKEFEQLAERATNGRSGNGGNGGNGGKGGKGSSRGARADGTGRSTRSPRSKNGTAASKRSSTAKAH